MNIKINDTIYSTDTGLTMLIFKNDEERVYVANLLLNMEPIEGKRRVLAFYNESLDGEPIEAIVRETLKELG